MKPETKWIYNIHFNVYLLLFCPVLPMAIENKDDVGAVLISIESCLFFSRYNTANEAIREHRKRWQRCPEYFIYEHCGQIGTL